MTVKISSVKYLNSLPFVYGIKHSGFLDNYKLELDIPSVCAEKLLTGKVDIGLIPVAVIPQMKEHHILTNYCIGANGEVKSVKLFSNVPLANIKKIYLDHESRTSVLLARILAKEFWKIDPEWVNYEGRSEQKIYGNSAAVVIGDRALRLNDKYPYSFDLAAVWKEHTSLPFVFACWVANKKLPQEFISSFGRAIGYGVRNREKSIETQQSKRYIIENISYDLDAEKIKAMKFFLDKLPQL